MKRYKLNKYLAAVLIGLMMSFHIGSSMNAEAFIFRPIQNITSLEDLMGWYGQAGMPVNAALSEDLIIDRPVELYPISEDSQTLCLNVQKYTIRIISGGVLIVNNPNLNFLGAECLLEVEGNGRLELIRGNIEPTVKPGIMVTLKDQATFLCKPEFIGLSPSEISDKRERRPPSENGLPNNTIPPQITDPPENTDEEESKSPEEGEAPQMGRAEIKRAVLVSVGSQANSIIRLDVTGIPENISELYLYRSSDGISWKRAVKRVPELSEQGNMVILEKENFLYGTSIEEQDSIVYHYTTDYKPIFLMAEIVTPSSSYKTNQVIITIPKEVIPGEVSRFPHEDDGSSGGNRGGIQGGGQRETEALPTSEAFDTQVSDPPMRKDDLPVAVASGHGVYVNHTSYDQASEETQVQEEEKASVVKTKKHVSKREESSDESESNTELEAAMSEETRPEDMEGNELQNSEDSAETPFIRQGFLFASGTTAMLLFISFLCLKKYRK